MVASRGYVIGLPYENPNSVLMFIELEYVFVKISLCISCLDLTYSKNLLNYFHSLLWLTVSYLKEISVTYSHVQLDL